MDLRDNLVLVVAPFEEDGAAGSRVVIGNTQEGSRGKSKSFTFKAQFIRRIQLGVGLRA